MRNKWTSDLMTGKLDEWFPPGGRAAGIEQYFSAAASLIECACSGEGFHFHFTANINAVPVEGQKSVIFVMSEENGLLPRYTGSVRAVFKCYGAKPFRTTEWSHPSLILSSCAKDAIVYKRALSSRCQWRLDQLRGANPFARPTVYHIPLGYYAFPPAEIPPWNARVNDVFFAGSLRQRAVTHKR
ncbi:MAG TPA: hypothetical protein VIT23_16160, partial [Terrimicrobiaceae bacterium]